MDIRYDIYEFKKTEFFIKNFMNENISVYEDDICENFAVSNKSFCKCIWTLIQQSGFGVWVICYY